MQGSGQTVTSAILVFFFSNLLVFCHAQVSEEVSVSMTNTDKGGPPSSSDNPSKSAPKDSKSSDDASKQQSGSDSAKDTNTAQVAESGGATATDGTSGDAKFTGQTGADSKGVSGLRPFLFFSFVSL